VNLSNQRILRDGLEMLSDHLLQSVVEMEAVSEDNLNRCHVIVPCTCVCPCVVAGRV
jgi:hypothetical protein